MNLEMFKDIKLVVSDFDGVFTDNKVIVSEDGKESVICNRGDSMYIKYLKERGIKFLILSGQTNIVVEKRVEKLQIECFYGVVDKLRTLKALMERFNLNKKQVCYIGNDLNDLECLEYVSLSICPFDSYPKVKEVSLISTLALGGQGVIREVSEYLLKANNL